MPKKYSRRSVATLFPGFAAVAAPVTSDVLVVRADCDLEICIKPASGATTMSVQVYASNGVRGGGAPATAADWAPMDDAVTSVASSTTYFFEDVRYAYWKIVCTDITGATVTADYTLYQD